MNSYVSVLDDSFEPMSVHLLDASDVPPDVPVEIFLLKLRKAIETIDVGVTITDTAGHIIFTNPADARLHGYAVEELIGQHACIFGTPGQHREMTTAELQRAENWQRESVNLRKDGSRFPVELVSTRVIDAAGQLIGMITVCKDITERKQAEERLRRAHEEALAYKNKELSTFALNLAEKNELLKSILVEVKAFANHRTTKTELKAFVARLSKQTNAANVWQEFEKQFNQLHDDFLRRLSQRFSDLTPRQLQICALLKINLSSKEIAGILYIADRSVDIQRHRIRQKLGLEADQNLTAFLQTL